MLRGVFVSDLGHGELWQGFESFFYGGLGCFWFVLGEEGEEEVSGMYFR